MANPTTDSHSHQDEQSVYMRAFDESTRQHLLDDDTAAWKAVCGLLITVASVGLLIGILGALFAV